MNLIQRIDALLPQTQCGKCGHPGCLPYAQGIAGGEAINKCPPGGAETIAGLAQLLRIPVLPLDTERGPAPAQVAYIREAECIGCTKCIQACPVDAIIGAAKLMHTVLVDECTGCDLCVAPCPVDCIDLLPLPLASVVPINGDLARDAGQLQARARKRDLARQRHEQRTVRLRREQEQRATRSQRPVPVMPSAVQPAPGAQDQALKQAKITLTMSRAQLNKSLKAFGHPPTYEQAMRLVQLNGQVEAAEQALAHLEQPAAALAALPEPVPAQPVDKPSLADLKRAKIQLAMARAALSKAQAANAPAEQIERLNTQLRHAEQAIQAAD